MSALARNEASLHTKRTKSLIDIIKLASPVNNNNKKKNKQKQTKNTTYMHTYTQTKDSKKKKVVPISIRNSAKHKKTQRRQI